MTRRPAAALLLALLSCAAPEVRVPNWTLVAERVWRSPTVPAAYALVDGDGAIVFGAPLGADLTELSYAGITAIEGAYLTHHHRDAAAGATAWAAAGVPARAPRASAPWITPEGVQRYWRAYLPASTPPLQAGVRERTFDAWEYLVLPEGLAAVDCVVEPGREFDWRGWTITPIATPGHTRGHVAYAARRKGAEKARPLVFSGDALAGNGTLWTPYTTDWDPATGDGLAAAAASLKTLAALDPEAVFPEHGEPLLEAPTAALSKAAEGVAEAAFLKSYGRYTKDRVGIPPAVRFLDRTQVGSDGRRPWTRLSDHLHFTGSTYAVSAARGEMWFIDPFGDLLAAQIIRAQTQRIGGDVDLVTITHAHGDHYGGLGSIPGRKGPDVWVMDQVAGVITDPAYRRSPHAHPRPVAVERVLADGERVAWRNYALSFRRLPGHCSHGSAIFTTIDGKRVVFAGDAFLHPDHDGGSGGWSGLNGGLPSDYAASADLILRAKPDWILASRGGPFEFVAEDWERRVAWGRAAAAACDRLSPSTDHRLDWNPGLLRVEPFLLRVSANSSASVDLVATNPLDRPQTLVVDLPGRGLLEDFRRTLVLGPQSTSRLNVPLKILESAVPGKHVFPLRVLAGDVERGDDAFFALDIADDR
ncbi:MAG TPA: MBL fold metallo-hydrolase [Planctomycetota bacterium]